MRKTVLLPALMMLSASLYASYFASNALGQDLGELKALSGSGYEGERNGGSTVIYLDGVPVRERYEEENGYRTVDKESEERVVLDESGRRIRWELTTPEREEVHTYFYEGERLSSASVSVNGELVSRIVYLDTPSGTPAGFSGSSSALFSPSFYLYEADDGFVRFSYHEDGRVTRSDQSSPEISYEIGEDGSWTEISEDAGGAQVIKRYDGSGLLAEEERNGIVTKYTYDDDGELASSSETAAGSEVISYYSDGKLERSSYLTNGIIDKERRYLPNGGIEETRYRDGVPEYRILFDGDGVRVREVERL